MANFYFEINDGSVKRFGSKYFTTSNIGNDMRPGQSSKLLLYSDRAWCEQEGSVWFIKHRHDPTLEVDMKEFMWVKLQAEFIS